MPTDKKKIDPMTNVMTTEKVNEIMEKEKLSLPLKLTERLWFNKKQGVRREGIKFAASPAEIDEYVKCKLSVYYFAEHYCKIKLEDGSVGQMHLRDYQKDIIKLYTENKYSILMASRQVGKCFSYLTRVSEVLEDGTILIKCVGTLYYDEIKKFRKLTIYEKIKLKLYNFIDFIS